MHQKLNFGVALLHCIPARSDVGPVTICSRVKIMSLLIYKILNYEGSIKTRMTIDHELVLNGQFFMITTMAASVLQLSHKTAKMSQ